MKKLILFFVITGILICSCNFSGQSIRAIDVQKVISEFEAAQEQEVSADPKTEQEPETTTVPEQESESTPESDPETTPTPEPDSEPELELEPEPDPGPMPQIPEPKELTLLIYMAADNDLESYALEDLKEMEHAAFDSINVLVLLDRAQGYDATDGDWDDTRLFEVTHDDTQGNFIVSKRLRCPNLGLSVSRETELDMANPSVLYNFINFAKTEYEAQKYALIIWGHGTGWRGVDVSQQAMVVQRAIAIDNYSDSYMSVYSMGRALKNAGLCVIGFDTCFGGVFENVYEIKNCAEYTVACPKSTPSYGWNYKQLLEDISESTYKTKDIAQLMANSSPVGTTIFENSKLKDVMDSFENFSEELSKTIVDIDSRNSVFTNLKNLKTYCYNQNPCDVYLDMRSLALSYSACSISKLAESATRFKTTLDKAARTTFSEFPEVGIYYIRKTESGSFDVRHSSAYLKDFDNTDQCLFIKESQWWVPTKEGGSDSLLDKLFYRSFN